MRAASRRVRFRRALHDGAWQPAKYAQFRDERLRPASDLLSRVPKLTAKQPSILDAGCGDGGPSRLLLERHPSARMLCLDSSPEMLSAAEADPGLSGRALVNFACQSIEEHFAPAAATSGPLYDLIFANASLQYCDDVPDLAARMLARVRPGGTLALQLPDTRQQPSHLLMHELANEFGPPADAIRVPTNTADPAAYAHALLGNHCASLDMWSTTYVQRLTGADPVYEYVRPTSLRRVLLTFGGAGSPDADAFEAAYRARLAEAYPKSHDGTTLFPFTRFFLVARRPSLLDVYTEYAAYHNHQLDKGWKS